MTSPFGAGKTTALCAKGQGKVFSGNFKKRILIYKTEGTFLIWRKKKMAFICNKIEDLNKNS
jgi:hypothetical protein